MSAEGKRRAEVMEILLRIHLLCRQSYPSRTEIWVRESESSSFGVRGRFDSCGVDVAHVSLESYRHGASRSLLLPSVTIEFSVRNLEQQQKSLRPERRPGAAQSSGCHSLNLSLASRPATIPSVLIGCLTYFASTRLLEQRNLARNSDY